MSTDKGEPKGLVHMDETRAEGKPETKEQKLHRELFEEVTRILADDRAVWLAFPNADKGAENYPDLANGPKVRFIMLKVPSGMTKDEICVAIIDNTGTDRPRSIGRSLHQDSRSEREIVVTRFQQEDLGEWLSGEGTYTRVVLSDTIEDASGTLFTKGRTAGLIEKLHGGTKPPSFAKHWRKGSGQLAPTSVVEAISKSPFQTKFEDLEDLLEATRMGVPNVELTRRVVAGEGKLTGAQQVTINPEAKVLPGDS